MHTMRVINNEGENLRMQELTRRHAILLRFKWVAWRVFTTGCLSLRGPFFMVTALWWYEACISIRKKAICINLHTHCRRWFENYVTRNNRCSWGGYSRTRIRSFCGYKTLGPKISIPWTSFFDDGSSGIYKFTVKVAVPADVVFNNFGFVGKRVSV